MSHKHIFLIVVAFTLAISAGSVVTEKDSTREFFSDIEKAILKDYHLCTGDLAIPSRKVLLKWISENNFITESENYPDLLKKYANETGINPADARPCEIVNWASQQLREKRDAEILLQRSQKLVASRRADSIYLHIALTENHLKAHHFSGFPFGIDQKAFRLLAAKKNISLIDKNTSLFADSIKIGSHLFSAAFHFDRNGKFSKYELESKSAPLDSLDLCIRPLADTLAFYMLEKVGDPPDHTYRVGRFDITQGRLAILQMWNLPEAAIYVGLSTFDYSYYAKLVVISNTASKKMEKQSIQQIKKNDE